MIACSVNQVGKMYGGNTIFNSITFEIQERDRVGLVGRNGSGKTTLFRLLAGEEAPDSGQIHWKKGSEIGYLAQMPEFHSKTITKDILKEAFLELLQVEGKMKQLELEMSQKSNQDKLQKLVHVYGDLQDYFTSKGGYEIESNIEKISNGLNINDLLDKSFAALSGGEKTKVSLGYMLLKNPDFLLLDEPTNHLDLVAVEWLGSFLKEYDGTVVVISHDRYFLDEVVNKILDLEEEEIICYHTDFSGFLKEKEKQMLIEFHAYEEQQKKIKKMKEAIKRLREWANRANPPNDGLHRRARNMERALERMEKMNRPILNRKKMNLEMEATDRSGKDVVIMRDVSKAFGEVKLFSHVVINVKYQQRVAIIGENGTGKSTLIKLILQQMKPDKGEVRVGSNVKIGYLSQHIFEHAKDETMMEAFRNVVRVTEGEARNILARFLFYGHMVFCKVSQLSGGEKMRLRLAQLMHQDINLLVLDEPTNHLDIESREILEEALEDYNGTIVAVSHDRYFLNKLFERIYWIESQEIHCFEGNYGWAKGKMAEKNAATVQHGTPVNKKPALVPKQEHTNDENMERNLEVLERKISVLDKQLMETKELGHLQQLYTERETHEKCWEEIYEQLND